MKKWKKAAKWGIILPVALVGTGGLAYAGIAIAGYVFNVGPLAQNKISLSQAFFGDESHTSLDLNWEYSISQASRLDEKTLMSNLRAWVTTNGRSSYFYENQLTITNIGKNVGNQTALLVAKSSSVNYQSNTTAGSGQLTLKYKVVQQKNLTDDLKVSTMPSTLQDTWFAQPTSVQFLNGVHDWTNGTLSNSNLDINQVDVDISSSSWNESLDPYSSATDLGAYSVNITVRLGSDVYVNTDTVTIYYRLQRALLHETLSNDIGDVYVKPENDDEAAELLCDANSTSISDIEAGGGEFKVTTTEQTDGNVLVTINSSTLYAGESFTRTYQPAEPLSLRSNDYFGAATANFFGTNANVEFTTCPSGDYVDADVIWWFNHKSSWAESFTLNWADIQIAVTDNCDGTGVATLSGKTGSYLYTTDTVALAFTYYFFPS